MQNARPDPITRAEDSRHLESILELIRTNDKKFKPKLEVYKLAKRFH
ncbi:MAG: hypothetical protein ACJA0N_001793, partial [Pseudohongiellaceae bacterium]